MDGIWILILKLRHMTYRHHIRDIIRSTSQKINTWFALCCGLLPIDFTHHFEDYFMGIRAFMWLCQCERSNHAGRHIHHITKYAYCITAIKQATFERDRQVGNPLFFSLLCVRLFIMITLDNTATKHNAIARHVDILWYTLHVMSKPVRGR